MLRRWHVTFRSHVESDSDVTDVSVLAASELEAIVKAKVSSYIAHPWRFAAATPWPRGKTFEQVTGKAATR